MNKFKALSLMFLLAAQSPLVHAKSPLRDNELFRTTCEKFLGVKLLTREARVVKKQGYLIHYVHPDIYARLKANEQLNEEELRELGLLRKDQSYFDLFRPNSFLLLRSSDFIQKDKEIENLGEEDIVFQLRPEWIKNPLIGMSRTYGPPVLVRIELPEKDEVYNSKFRTLAQKLYHYVLMHREIPLIVTKGAAGSGKTRGALLAGLNLKQKGRALNDGRFISKGPNRNSANARDQFLQAEAAKPQVDTRVFAIESVKEIVVTRRPVEMGDKIGFLPGDEYEKMVNYLRPFISNYYQITGKNNPNPANMLTLPTELKLLPYSLIRGETISNSFMIIDEGQNVGDDFKTLITRSGEGSKFVVMGDDGQPDDKKLRRQDNALNVSLDMFEDSWLMAYIMLPMSVRSELAYESQERYDQRDALLRNRSLLEKLKDSLARRLNR